MLSLQHSFVNCANNMQNIRLWRSRPSSIKLTRALLQYFYPQTSTRGKSTKSLFSRLYYHPGWPRRARNRRHAFKRVRNSTNQNCISGLSDSKSNNGIGYNSFNLGLTEVPPLCFTTSTKFLFLIFELLRAREGRENAKSFMQVDVQVR